MKVEGIRFVVKGLGGGVRRWFNYEGLWFMWRRDIVIGVEWEGMNIGGG